MDGLLVIDKPAGLTSHDVVVRARRILRERRVGHTGTLDPFATGVLVILLGRATRLAQFLSGVDKEYEAIIRLGYSTDTGDLTGNPIPGPTAKPDAWTETEIENKSRSDESRQRVVNLQSIKKVETPEDLFGMLLFLASPASGFMTGQSLVVDGGTVFL